MNSSLANLSLQQLQRAILIKEKIEALEKELTTLLEIPAPVSAVAAPQARRRMSAAGRAAIRAAQKARWAKIKAAASAPAAVPAKAPGKRPVSAPAPARIKAAKKA